MSQQKLNLVICWHMHQPWYRESLNGDYRLPWVYLHALKDYSDMLAHLQAHKKMRAVVNFTPVLLEQLDDYAKQLKRWMNTGHKMDDPLLNLLAENTKITEDIDQRVKLVQTCLRAHAPEMIDPYPNYVMLLDLACKKNKTRKPDKEKLRYLNSEYFLDLLTWYHLAWLGHSVKQDPQIKTFFAQCGGFSRQQRHILLALMAELFTNLIPGYKTLADEGRIELSFTPYSHPLMPLLTDFKNMQCTQPESPKPNYTEYPNGSQRARWHIKHGINVFKKYFNREPQGIWLSEGSISEDTIEMLPYFDLKWTASGEAVWENSCYLSNIRQNNPTARHGLFCPHQFDDIETNIFFRDDGLSDLIGFEYQHWHANDAANDFMHHLKNIADYLGDDVDKHVVSVILDGENAWEYYQDNAFHFIGALYESLSHSDFVNVTTFSEVLDCCPPRVLPKICAGSWVYGSFSTWIGDIDKNQGWDRLIEAKQVYDQVIQKGILSKEQENQAGLQLAVCESSDWFWWFGDYNPTDSVRQFDELFRMQLRNLYTLLQQPIPENLNTPISNGGGNAENAGTMRRGQDH